MYGAMYACTVLSVLVCTEYYAHTSSLCSVGQSYTMEELSSQAPGFGPVNPLARRRGLHLDEKCT